jgi:hypothetical protein
MPFVSGTTHSPISKPPVETEAVTRKRKRNEFKSTVEQTYKVCKKARETYLAEGGGLDKKCEDDIVARFLALRPKMQTEALNGAYQFTLFDTKDEWFFALYDEPRLLRVIRLIFTDDMRPGIENKPSDKYVSVFWF